VFSAEKSKIVRMFADFLRPEGTGEAWIQPSAPDSCSIISIVDRVGALRTRVLPKEPSPRILALQDDFAARETVMQVMLSA
jgi:hypothetical protein